MRYENEKDIPKNPSPTDQKMIGRSCAILRYMSDTPRTPLRRHSTHQISECRGHDAYRLNSIEENIRAPIGRKQLIAYSYVINHPDGKNFCTTKNVKLPSSSFSTFNGHQRPSTFLPLSRLLYYSIAPLWLFSVWEKERTMIEKPILVSTRPRARALLPALEESSPSSESRVSLNIL